MSEMAETFRALRDHKKALRAKLGTPCPECRRRQPRRHPTILMPQQRCRVDDYRDPRPELTDEEWASA